jgi:hypothetical protein
MVVGAVSVAPNPDQPVVPDSNPGFTAKFCAAQKETQRRKFAMSTHTFIRQLFERKGGRKVRKKFMNFVLLLYTLFPSQTTILELRSALVVTKRNIIRSLVVSWFKENQERVSAEAAPA